MTATEHGFKAEVQQLLDLMIHSLYSDKEVFLRELVSNAADALDKVRFLELTRADLVAAAGEPGVRVSVDAEARTVTIEDDGVGLSHDEAVMNLGTIAHSGSAAFLASLKDAPADQRPKLIGQFGVGFYSAFMVAEEVVVESRSALPEAEPVRWTSRGQGSFTVEAGERAARGTRITLKLREDDADFADADRLRAIVRRHADFLPWPVLVDGEQANRAKALWAEQPSAVSAEEANAFYKSLTMDWQDPALRVHLNVDSPLQYQAMLFIPSERPHDLFRPDADKGPRLYAKRVLILEHAKDLLPDWLRFVRGVVDSEDVQLNVSREMVQKTPAVKKIRDAITGRFLKDLQRLADGPVDEQVEDGETPRRERFFQIWRNFGVVLKEGFVNSPEHRERLQPLLRFNALSHADAEGLLSLDEYKAAMPEGQEAIWFLAAETRAAALASPHLEAFRKKGWDVLLLTDPVDEWLMRDLTEHAGVPLKSVARGDLDLTAEEGGEKADLSGLTPWLAEIYGDELAGVRASGRLTDSACVLVDDEDGISSNMERILQRAQESSWYKARRYLELNPRHPLVRNLAALKERGSESEAEPLARLLLDEALLLEGTVKDPAAIGRRLQGLLERASQLALGA